MKNTDQIVITKNEIAEMLHLRETTRQRRIDEIVDDLDTCFENIEFDLEEIDELETSLRAARKELADSVRDARRSIEKSNKQLAKLNAPPVKLTARMARLLKSK